MNKLIEDWIVNEILDTLRQARISLLGITALDSPLELERKTKENSTAITRRIEKVLDLIDPSKLSTDWTEEDELMRSAVLSTLDRIGDVGTVGMQKDWLKSLPHSTPTKEQPVDLDDKTIMEEIRKLGCYPSEFDVARHFVNLGKKIEQTRFGAILKEKALDAKARPYDDELWVDLRGQGLKDGESVKVLIIKQPS